jgi:hypothetical protein
MLIFEMQRCDFFSVKFTFLPTCRRIFESFLREAKVYAATARFTFKESQHKFYYFYQKPKMNKIAALLIALVFSVAAPAQDGFRFDNPKKKKISIPFKFINNLIILPVEVNGTPMNFLLDTGVDETILFSLDDQKDLTLNSVEKIRLKGLGGNEAVEGLKSSHNKMAFRGYSDPDHDIYIVLDQSFNFSASIGIPVNGILGYHFFKNNLVELNYDRRKVIVHNPANPGLRKKIARQFASYDVTIEENKPYAMSGIAIEDDDLFQGKLLIDSGSTDAVWLFMSKSDKVVLPKKHFDDFLGRGLSGDILGKRGRIKKFVFQTNEFDDAIVSFPDAESIKNITFAKDRIGSVGGEILKRFSIILDYRDKKVYLRKSKHFYDPFSYNMSGIEVHHEGMSWVQERVIEQSPKKSTASHEVSVFAREFTYKFELKPIFSIANVRKDSPADLCGLQKGDILLRINGMQCYKLSLQEINAILKSEEGKTIELEIERQHKPMKYEFKLKSII